MMKELYISMVKMELHNNGKQKCSICKLTIPGNILRLSIDYKSRYGPKQIRICSKCILKLNQKVKVAKNMKNIKAWEKNIMVKEL